MLNFHPKYECFRKIFYKSQKKRFYQNKIINKHKACEITELCNIESNFLLNLNFLILNNFSKKIYSNFFESLKGPFQLNLVKVFSLKICFFFVVWKLSEISPLQLFARTPCRYGQKNFKTEKLNKSRNIVFQNDPQNDFWDVRTTYIIEIA